MIVILFFILFYRETWTLGQVRLLVNHIIYYASEKKKYMYINFKIAACSVFVALSQTFFAVYTAAVRVTAGLRLLRL